MSRMALVLVILAMGLLGDWNRVGAASQGAASPTVSAASEPVSAGDWAFQLIDVERLDSYYAEQFGEVYQPDGVYLVIGLAITYKGTSTNDLDRYLPSNWFEITSDSEEVFGQADIYAEFLVEESNRTDYPYPHVPITGVAEPGVTYYKRFIYDVPADASGLALASSPSAPGEFAIPLPDTANIAGQAEWELQVLDAMQYDILGPPLTTGSRFEPDGLYLVVDIQLTRLPESSARIDATWFALRTSGGEPIPIALDETIALGVPLDAEGGATYAFALVFDVPPGIAETTLATTPGAPLSVEVPLSMTMAPTATPTPPPTPTWTPAPTATFAPTSTATPEPTATSTPPPTATSTPTPLPPTATSTPTPLPTATPSPEPTAATDAPTQTPVPQPGAIRVVTSTSGAPVPPNARGAVELILDTSGSMLQPMGDRLRIDVAKEVLTTVVTGQLPPGTQTALRVFGTVPGSCETSLAIPLGPLDPGVAASTISSIVAINEVRTPLGASLEAAGDDLSAVNGPKLIVLITDGEETCGGDPGAVISALAAQDIDVRINIVGFAIDDPQIEQTLAAWAEQGGGQYISADAASDLGPALTQALQPTFEVRDSDGVLIGTGTVNGEAVPAPAGRYTVVVNTAPPVTEERVVVDPGETTEVVLGE